MQLDVHGHLDQDLVADYAAGLADEEQRFVIDMHVAECPTCLRLVTEAQLLANLWDSWTPRRHSEALARLWEQRAGALQFAIVLGAVTAEAARRARAFGMQAQREHAALLLGGETVAVDAWQVPLPGSDGAVALRLSRSEKLAHVQVEPSIADAATNVELILWEVLEDGTRRRAAQGTYAGSPVTLETTAAGDFVLSLATLSTGRRRGWEIKLRLD